MLYWYVQNKRIDALEWSKEPIWRFFTVLHDGVQEEVRFSSEEHEFPEILHPRLPTISRFWTAASHKPARAYYFETPNVWFIFRELHIMSIWKNQNLLPLIGSNVVEEIVG